jgi:hypothetical protein
MLARYLRRIRITRSVPALHARASEIERDYPTDEATPRLLALAVLRVKPIAGEN